MLVIQAKYGPSVQSLTEPCPANWPGTAAKPTKTPDVVIFNTRIGPLARAYREQGRAHLTLYDPEAAMACVEDCLKLVSLPYETM
jgi:hypothetical protein